MTNKNAREVNEGKHRSVRFWDSEANGTYIRSKSTKLTKKQRNKLKKAA